MDVAVVTELTTIEQLKKHLGRELSLSKWVLVSQEMVNSFAQATGDRQFIHLDTDRAKETPFGGTIAHGFFILSILLGFLDTQQEGNRIKFEGGMDINYGLNKVRFISPVPVGKRVRARNKLLSVEEGPSAEWVQTTLEQTVEVEGLDRPAMVAETILRHYF